MIRFVVGQAVLEDFGIDGVGVLGIGFWVLEARWLLAGIGCRVLGIGGLMTLTFGYSIIINRIRVF